MKLKPEKRREIIHKLDITLDKKPQNVVQKKLSMENVHGTFKADNIFGGIGYSKEK